MELDRRGPPSTPTFETNGTRARANDWAYHTAWWGKWLWIVLKGTLIRECIENQLDTVKYCTLCLKWSQAACQRFSLRVNFCSTVFFRKVHFDICFPLKGWIMRSDTQRHLLKMGSSYSANIFSPLKLDALLILTWEVVFSVNSSLWHLLGGRNWT